MPTGDIVSGSGRALRTAAVFAVAPAVLAGVVVALAAGWIFGVVALVVVGSALGAWALLAGDRLVASRLGGRPADPRADARLWNLVEGLATGAGVHQPRLLVVDSPGLNAMAAGRSGSGAVLAVTSGLLVELERIELEAVIAEQLYMIRHEEMAAATVLVATLGVGRSIAIRGDRDSAADQGAISLTRYPPALAAALEKIEAKGAEVDGQPAHMAHLWMVDPRPTPPASRGRLPISERVEALREL
jgi:Zn-dependent protease with chaperone function